MLRRRSTPSRFATLVVAELFLALAVPAAASAASAGETVRALYGPPIWNPLENDDFKPMTGPALKLFKKSAEVSAASGEMGCIDFVVTTSGQDYDEAEIAKTLKVAETGQDAAGDTLVKASFHAFPDTSGEPAQEVVWTMHKAGKGWKVSDIENAKDGWKLSEMSCE